MRCVPGIFTQRMYNGMISEYEKTRIKLIPYNAFANRGDASMLVWLRRE